MVCDVACTAPGKTVDNNRKAVTGKDKSVLFFILHPSI
jgi:hypothetical protein